MQSRANLELWIHVQASLMQRCPNLFLGIREEGQRNTKVRSWEGEVGVRESLACLWLLLQVLFRAG